MSQEPQTITASTTPTAYGYCSYHGGDAEDVRLIDVLEQQSRGGVATFACPPCRERLHLVPLADRP